MPANVAPTARKTAQTVAATAVQVPRGANLKKIAAFQADQMEKPFIEGLEALVAAARGAIDVSKVANRMTIAVPDGPGMYKSFLPDAAYDYAVASWIAAVEERGFRVVSNERHTIYFRHICVEIPRNLINSAARGG